MGEDEVQCLRVAAQQDGVIRRDQALRWLSPHQVQHRVATGAWAALLPRVFRVEGARQSWRQMLKAVSLWAGHGYALSHRTAAALHGFRRFAEGPIELSVTRNLAAPPPVVVHRTGRLEARDFDSAQGFRVTSVTRTLLDLCAVVPAADLRATVDEALQRRRTTLERLAVALQQVERPRGVAFLRELVREYQGGDGPCESELEARVFELIEQSGLPRPVRQRRVVIGGRLYRLDYCFPGRNVIIEADGFAHHSSPLAFEKDRQRNNSLALRGFVVLHWTWRALHDRPDGLLKELAGLLAQRAS